MKTQTFINFTIVILAAISCAISISNNSIYQDGEWANAQWLGQDIVTLCLAVPLLLLSVIKGVRQQNKKWLILNSGLLLYFAYTYCFYAFVAQLTFLYLFQFPIFGLSVIGFVMGCIHLFQSSWNMHLASKGVRFSIIVYLSLVALMLSVIWLSDIFAHLSDPEHRSATPNGEAPLIIYSLDLGIIIPLMLASAILLYKKSNYGFLLCGIILTKTSTLGFAHMAMSVSLYLQHITTDHFLIMLWCIIGVIGTFLTLLYLKNLLIRPEEN